MKRQSKADLILSEARGRLESARETQRDAENALAEANAAFMAHQESYYALELQLAPKPRKKVVKEVQKEPEKIKEPVCSLCSNVEDYVDHSQPSPSYHEFQTAKGKKKAA